MTGSRAEDLPAAQWAHQQNIGETSQDLQDKSNGVRCILHGGPCNGLHVAEYAEERLEASGRGYAPEYIRRPSDIPTMEYYYKWVSRDSEGIHHYFLEGRKGYSGDERRDEVLVLFRGGPLYQRQEWLPRPESAMPPDTIRVVGRVHYKFDAKNHGVWCYHGKYRCRYFGLSPGALPHGGQEFWASAEPSGDEFNPPELQYDHYGVFRRRGESRKIVTYYFERPLDPPRVDPDDYSWE